MNRIILASHGGLSAGMLDTARMIVGDLPNVYAVSTQRDETETIVEVTRKLIQGFGKGDRVFILTDILSGSVNNDMLSLVGEFPDITVICGMNVCLVLEMVTMDDDPGEEEIRRIIEESRGQITNCTEELRNAMKQEEEDDL